MTFQLVAILFFVLLSITAFFSKEESRTVYFLFCQAVMLALFPFWINAYIGGVMNNSDGADLTVHWQFGMVLYGALVLLDTVTLVWVIGTIMKQNK
jgi:hypothetical protein